MLRPGRRLIIVVRADPVICGHSSEARNLAESAIEAGFKEVRIVTWPLDAIAASGLPMKPQEGLLSYSPGIFVERPEPVGDYKVMDGRFTTGLSGRLVELLIDGTETIVLSMYLLPHTPVVGEAVHAARKTGLAVRVTTVAEAVGSDITNVVRNAVKEQRYGPAVLMFANYLAQDSCVAVSQFTRKLIIESAQEVDAACGTTFAEQCRDRVFVSYPAIDTRSFVEFETEAVEKVLWERGLRADGYILFLSRIALAKGVDDLIEAYRSSRVYGLVPLVIAGDGPARPWVESVAAHDENILVFCDVDDDEKKALMRGSAAYVLPSKPRPEFVETFGIALAEKMLVGGPGPILTTRTGGIPEAVGDCAIPIEAGNVSSIREALERALLTMTREEKQALSHNALDHALRFDRRIVFERLMEILPSCERYGDPVVSAAG